MSLSVETLAVARKYTDDSLAGAGAVAGVPCKIQSITAITGGNRVTFLWTDNNGDDHTSAMDVMNGVDGEDGKGIQSVSVNAQNHLIITYTDGTTVDAGQIEIHSSVDSVNGQTGAVVLDAEDVGALPDNTPIPSKTSDLTNDSGFATTSDVSTALADYTKTADLTTLLAAKQDTLTFDNAPTENSNNPVKSGGVYSAEADIFAVMGQNGAKNLIPFDLASIKAKNSQDYPSGSWNNNEWTINGVTFAIQDDNTVVATGSNTSNSNAQLDYYITIKGGVSYIANGCPSGGSASTYRIANYCSTLPMETFADNGNGVAITRAADTAIIVHMQVKAGYTIDGQLVFKPMIRLATDSDATYQPYAKTNQELTAENEALTNQANDMVNVLGAKNLLPNKATTQVSYGVTFTVNDDGSVKANGTNDGTQTSAIFPFVVTRNLIADYFPSMDETYVGYMSASNTLLELLIIWEDENKTTISQTRTKTKVEFTIPSNAVYFRCDFRVAQNATVSNEIAYPMICLKSVYDLDDTFEPYAKTNRQLTQDSVTWDDLSKVGAVNYCKNKASSTTTTDGTTTFTWTVNDDKSVTVSAPSYPVTVASNQNLVIWNPVSAEENKVFVNKVWRLTGCPNSDCTIELFRVGSEGGTTGSYYDTGEGLVFTWLNNASGTKVAITLGVKSGTTLTEAITFKPMIAPVDYNGPYVPYAKTNRELTENKVDILTKWVPTLMSSTIGEGFITDLDTPLTSPTQNGMLGFNRYNSSASNKPSNNSGVVLTWETSENYGCQLVLSDGGLYFRTNHNGTVSSWKQVAFTT